MSEINANTPENVRDKKMAEFLQAEEQRRKLREEKDAKVAAEWRERDDRTVEEALARRKEAQEAIERERAEIGERNKKIDEVLARVFGKPTDGEEAESTEVPKEPETAEPEETKEVPLEEDLFIKAPFGTYLPFDMPEVDKKSAMDFFSIPRYEKSDYPVDPHVCVGREKGVYTLEEMVNIRMADIVNSNDSLTAEEARNLLEEQKRADRAELDRVRRKFLAIIAEQRRKFEEVLSDAIKVKELAEEFRGHFYEQDTAAYILRRLAENSLLDEDKTKELAADIKTWLREKRTVVKNDVSIDVAASETDEETPAEPRDEVTVAEVATVSAAADVLDELLAEALEYAPAEEAEKPAEETPVEEAPAEEIPTEEAPAEETPAEEATKTVAE